MKSSTVIRSNLSKEKIAVLEALSKYKHDSSDVTPNVYMRSNKEKELDLLWQNFKVSQKSEKSPAIYLGTGFIAGIVTASLMFGILGLSLHGTASQVPAPVEKAAKSETINLVPAAETTAATVSGNEVYTVQSGDTMESILTRFYGGYTQERAWAVMNANNMKNPHKLSIGQKLNIPVLN